MCTYIYSTRHDVVIYICMYIITMFEAQNLNMNIEIIKAAIR